MSLGRAEAGGLKPVTAAKGSSLNAGFELEKQITAHEPSHEPSNHSSQKSDNDNDAHGLSLVTSALSRLRTPDDIPITPPPDGGARAWSMVLLSSFVNLNSWGFINSFGLFQTYYVNEMRLGSYSQVAWIGSLQVFLLFGIGTFSGRALDGGYFRPVFWIGSFLHLFGMFMLSLCRSYWEVFLAEALCIGIGYGLVFVPCIALASTYFSHAKRALALAVVVSGSSVGGMIFPAIADNMLYDVGLPWTIRTIAFIQAILSILCWCFLKPRLPPRKSGPVVEWAAFRELPYLLYCLGSYCFYWGVYIGFYYVGSYGRDVLGTSQSTSINLLLTLNGVGLPARFVASAISEKVTGPINAILPYVAGTGLVTFTWAAVDSETGLWIFTVMLAVVATGILGLYPVVLTSLTDDPNKMGVRSGMGFSIIGCAVLTGPPIAGALVERMKGSYVGLSMFAGCTMATGFAFTLAARWAKVGWKLKVKI